MNEDFYKKIVEKENKGKKTKKTAATPNGNPFDGYGRPFSDNGGMSEFYYHDNPANNVGPYTGPTDYSINNVAPYHPPADEENPAQNVGPYNPPRVETPTTDGDYDEDDLPANAGEGDTDNDSDNVRQAYSKWDETNEWFDGTSTTIYTRIIEAQNLKMAAEQVEDYDLLTQIDAQIDTLSKVAAEFDESNLYEFVSTLPGGTVALDYQPLEGGLVGIGEDDDSFLYKEASKIIGEVKDYDWYAFEDEGARQFVASKEKNNPGVLEHEVLTREAAVDYARDHTTLLINPIQRATIIDSFVNNVERYRRGNMQHRERTAKKKEAEVQKVATSVPEPNKFEFPGQSKPVEAALDESGNLTIGEDDGSSWYKEASAVKKASSEDWPTFTTLGAKKWAYAQFEDNPGIVDHKDLVLRAAKEYAENKTSLVFDGELREDIIDAFVSSVNYIREASTSAPDDGEETD